MPNHLLKRTLFLFLWLIGNIAHARDKRLMLTSPNQKLTAEIAVGEQIRYRLLINGQEVLAFSPLSMALADGRTLGRNGKLQKTVSRSVNQVVKPLYGMNSQIQEQFNELTLPFKENFSVVFRAYNDGLAYRFVTRLPGQIRVQREEVTLNFPQDVPGYFSRLRDKDAPNSYEVHYERLTISKADTGFSYLPILMETPASGAKLLITEADLRDYPGLYLESDGKTSLTAYVPPVVTATKPLFRNGVAYNLQPTARQDYIAETAGTRSFPWRVIGVYEADKDLLNSQLVYLLGAENVLPDVSWIRPGKVAWDWWSDINLTGVPFKTGYNTESFKYFIDFAARNGIEYVNIDDGWSVRDNLLKVTDQLDMPEVIRYAKEKKVGLFLWCIWHVLDKQMVPALDQFEKWGIAGVKVDFMDRDDQEVVNYYERLANECAKRHILINFHGAMKPTGLERTYPNIINREAVQGLEYSKFSTCCTPEHALHVPFIRMATGSMDYTPGAMTNAVQRNFRQIYSQPMSQGTRCQQMAMYVAYYAPLEMMADAPTAYEADPPVLKFLAQAPTVWDETVPLDGKVGDYLAVARRKGTDWYVGCLTDWTARTLTVDLSFLGEGTYTAEIFADGVNAERVGTDYQHLTRTVTSADKLPISMAPGGGWTARFTPVR